MQKTIMVLAVMFLCACTKKQEANPLPPVGLAGNSHSALAHDPSSIRLDTHPKQQPMEQKPGPMLKGEALEVITNAGFTYINLRPETGVPVWVALINADVKKGQKITIEQQTTLDNFHAKSLNRTFDHIIFGIKR